MKLGMNPRMKMGEKLEDVDFGGLQNGRKSTT